MTRIALAGQPNSGKSTIFNQVAGYRQITSNFPGKTVQYFLSKVSIEGEVVELVDLPRTYSLTSSDDAELEARNYILRGEADVIINVIDATALGRSLEFTLQLMQLGRPLVVCLNMMDETARAELSEKLTIVEIKVDGLKDLLPYKIKETIEKVKKTQTENEVKTHNPAIGKSDWIEVFGVAFGLVDLLIFFVTIYESPTLINKLAFWILFFVMGLFGILPVAVSEKRIAKERRAILSLLSLIPWAYLVLVQLDIISPFL